MRQTWRWFGPADAVSIDEVRQAGAEGVVSALHHILPGEVWPVAEIEARQAQIAGADGDSGLAWEVVESVPVSEAIKTRSGPVRAHLDAYADTLRNLAACKIKVVCYNFMPILDWTRTSLATPLPFRRQGVAGHGGTAMRFDLTDFALFDIFVLERPDAAADWPGRIRDAAQRRLAVMRRPAREALAANIVAGLPGATDGWTLAELRDRLAAYRDIDAGALRDNLVAFLAEMAPVAADLGLRLCAHPDDPPFPLLGLPRILSTEADYAAILDTVDIAASGITLCTGSLGVRDDFDAAGFVRRLGGRIHFAHLRNTARYDPGDGVRSSFVESAHLDGDTDMVAAIRALLTEERRRRAEGRADAQIPMRPDHGHALACDLARPAQPGYPLVGRLRGLAELRGVMAALTDG